MDTLARRWADFVIGNRFIVIFISIVLLAIALFFGRGIPFDNSTERYFLEGDPNLLAFDELVELFGDNEYLVVGVSAREQDQDIFEMETLNLIAKVTEFLEDNEYVTQVRSITRYQYTHADDFSLSTDDLIGDLDELAEQPERLEDIREIMAGEHLALGTLITEDFQHTRIAARVEYRRDTAEHKLLLVQALYDFVEEEGLGDLGYRIRYSGQPLINASFEIYTREDSQLLNPLMALFMLITLFVSFRSLSGAILPWMVIGGGVVYVVGIQGVLGFPHSPVDSALVPTMIIVGIGVSVHVLVGFYHQRGEGVEPQQAAKNVIQSLWKPAFFTAITTSAGFSALAVTKIVPVREFAVLGAIGPLLLFLLAMTVLPALLSFVKGFSAKTASVVESGLVSRFTAAIPMFTFRYKKPLLWIGAGLLAFAIVAVPKIRVDSNFLYYFKEHSPPREDMVYFDEAYQGVVSFEAIIDSGEEGGVKDPKFLARIDSFEQFLEQRDALGTINSLTDYLKKINQSLHADNPDYYILPDSKEMTAQMLFLYENSGPEEDLTDIKDFDDRYVRLTVPVVNMRASDMTKELEFVYSALANEYSDLSVTLTGGMVMFNAQDRYTSEGMFKSFTIALLVICICFVFLFRSFKYGILVIIPSIVPILLTGGIVGLLGIYLDMGTMIVGAMTMGIAVDDAIHVMSRYLSAKEEGATTYQAVERAMTESGRAVVFTSIVLVLGFSVLTTANFVPIIFVGVFGASIMLLALVGDLIFLPAILFWIDGEEEEGPEGEMEKPQTKKPEEENLITASEEPGLMTETIATTTTPMPENS